MVLSIGSLRVNSLGSAGTRFVRATLVVAFGSDELFYHGKSMLQAVEHAHGTAVLGDAIEGVRVEDGLAVTDEQESHSLLQRTQDDLHVILEVIDLMETEKSG
jgi:hypothetical protein